MNRPASAGSRTKDRSMEYSRSPVRAHRGLRGWVSYIALRYPLEGLVYWFCCLVLSVVAAGVLVGVFIEHVVPPGGDPGNWAATSLAFMGRPYPSQLVPLSYPPMVFPLLGAAIAVTGSPVAGIDLFAGSLMVALGLSIGAVATTVLRNRVVALAVTALLLIDPSILAMFFWGAYPNILGFVFQNLALVGLLRAGRGHTSTGAAQFWGFFTLTMLSHSLVGLVLAVTTALYLSLGLFSPMPAWGRMLDQARKGALESPAIATRALFTSRGGRGGLVVFLAFVGGYYGVTALAGIPHPYYFSSNPVGFRLVSMGAAFQALLPGVIVQPPLVVAILIIASILAVIGFAIARDARPRWLTAPAVLLLAWPLSIALMLIGGYILQIVTDYHRFGFFFLIPTGLVLGYLVERGWVSRLPPAHPEADPPAPGADLLPARIAVFRLPAPWRRPVVFGVVTIVVLVIVVDVATGPALARFEATFTKTGHDAAFLDAVNAIRRSGMAGGILTVPGADKWARGLTGDNSFAPYSSTAFLFYPSQELDSQYAYYALMAHYAVTNGLVAATVHARHAAFADGVPDYSVYVLGTARQALRIAPADIRVVLYDSQNGSVFAASLTTDPLVTLPVNYGDPMRIQYQESAFSLVVSATVLSGTPEVDVSLTASASPPYSIVAFDTPVTPPTGISALAWPSSVPGGFYWTDIGTLRRPLTYGNVTPASALKGATDYDAATGGPAALISFTAPTATGSPSVGGTVTFATPQATAFLSGYPGILSTPAIWQALGIRFILMQNATAAPTPTQSFAGEIPYLVGEYGLPTLYQNTEWTVLEVPSGYPVGG